MPTVGAGFHARPAWDGRITWVRPYEKVRGLCPRDRIRVEADEGGSAVGDAGKIGHAERPQPVNRGGHATQGRVRRWGGARNRRRPSTNGGAPGTVRPTTYGKASA